MALLQSFFGDVSLSVILSVSISFSLSPLVACFCSSTGLSVLKCERKCKRTGKLVQCPPLNCICLGNIDTSGLQTDGLLTKARPT